MLKKTLLLSALLFGISESGFAAPLILTGNATVNVTSDTAAAAKNIAFDNARRQIVRDVLSPYADKVALANLVKAAGTSDLTNLVATSSIDGEQQSATTYSANITMTLDNAAVRKWLTANNVKSWLPNGDAGGQIVVFVTLRDRVADWMQLNQIARGENIDLNTRNISGNQLTISIPESGHKMFVAAARASGWQYDNDGGAMRLWK